MSGEDGQIRIKVNLDTQELDKDIQKVQDKLSRQNETLSRQTILVEKLTARYEQLYAKAQETSKPNAQSNKIFEEIRKLEGEYSNLQNAFKTAKLDPNVDEYKLQKILDKMSELKFKIIDLKKQYNEAKFSPDMQNKLRSLGQEIDLAISKEERLTNEVKRTEDELEKLSSKRISSSDKNINGISKNLEEIKDKVSETTDQFEKMHERTKGIFSSLGDKISGIGRRILNLAMSAFVFNIISSGFRAISRGIQTLLSQDESFNNSLQNIKANLATAFYPIYQACLPALRSLGQMLSWISGQVASFISMITGTSIKANQEGAQSIMKQANPKMPSDNLSEGYDNIGKSAKSSEKDIKSLNKTLDKNKRELASFDKIEVLKSENSQSGIPKSPSGDIGKKSSMGSATSTISGFNQELGKLDTSFLDGIIRKFKELSDLFSTGFDVGFIDRNFNQIIDGLERIGRVSKRILNDPKVATGFNKALNSIVYNLGVISGSIVSVGITTGRLLVGGIAHFLEQSEERIKKQLTKCFNITTEVSNFAGNISSAFANIFEVFGGQEAQRSLGNLLSGCEAIIGDFVLNVSDIMVTLGQVILSPFINHQDEIKQAYQGILEAIEPITNGIKTHFENLGDSFNSITENSIKPALQTIGKIWDDIFGKIVQSWNKYVSPKLKEIGDKFNEVMNGKVGDAIRKVTGFINKFWEVTRDIIGWLWNLLKPFVNWFIETFIDNISEGVKNMSVLFMDVFGEVVSTIGNFWDMLTGLIDFITGMFTGNWEKAWKGAEKAFNGFVNVMKSSVNVVISLINGLVNGVTSAINAMIRGLNRISFDLPDWLGGGHFGLNIPEIPKNWGNIPKLAKGAVLEGGNPFLAWVNDQPKGQKNIETPLSTMIEAFKQAGVSSQSKDIVIEANGDFSQFIRFLNFKIKEEDARIGQSFVSGDSWI